jgi:hypothetical protein
MFRASWLGMSVISDGHPKPWCYTFAWQLRIALRALQFKRFRLYQQRVVCKHVKFPFCWESVTSSADNINSLQWAVVTARDARCHDVTMDLNEWYENAMNSDGSWEPHRIRYESAVNGANMSDVRISEPFGLWIYSLIKVIKIMVYCEIVKFGDVTLSVWVLIFEGPYRLRLQDGSEDLKVGTHLPH